MTHSKCNNYKIGGNTGYHTNETVQFLEGGTLPDFHFPGAPTVTFHRAVPLDAQTLHPLPLDAPILHPFSLFFLKYGSIAVSDVSY